MSSAIGCTAAVRTLFASRVQGSVAYSLTNAQMTELATICGYLVLLAPSALHRNAERIHDVATSIETNVPETSTRVLVLYRVSNGFARPSGGKPGPSRAWFTIRCAGPAVAALPEFHQREMGDADRGP